MRAKIRIVHAAKFILGIAGQRFFLGMSTGIAMSESTSLLRPASPSYSAMISDQVNQNYEVLAFGDVASPFVQRGLDIRSGKWTSLVSTDADPNSR